jgi:hypothetical protein
MRPAQALSWPGRAGPRSSSATRGASRPVVGRDGCVDSDAPLDQGGIRPAGRRVRPWLRRGGDRPDRGGRGVDRKAVPAWFLVLVAPGRRKRPGACPSGGVTGRPSRSLHETMAAWRWACHSRPACVAYSDGWDGAGRAARACRRGARYSSSTPVAVAGAELALPEGHRVELARHGHRKRGGRRRHEWADRLMDLVAAEDQPGDRDEQDE